MEMSILKPSGMRPFVSDSLGVIIFQNSEDMLEPKSL